MQPKNRIELLSEAQFDPEYVVDARFANGIDRGDATTLDLRCEAVLVVLIRVAAPESAQQGNAPNRLRRARLDGSEFIKVSAIGAGLDLSPVSAYLQLPRIGDEVAAFVVRPYRTGRTWLRVEFIVADEEVFTLDRDFDVAPSI